MQASSTISTQQRNKLETLFLSKRSLTIGDIVDYVIANRKGAAFRNWEPSTIAIAFRDKLPQKLAAYYCSASGEIDGVVICSYSGNTLFIDNILTTSREAIKAFAAIYEEYWPNTYMTAKRKSYTVSYDTKRLCHLLKTLN